MKLKILLFGLLFIFHNNAFAKDCGNSILKKLGKDLIACQIVEGIKEKKKKNIFAIKNNEADPNITVSIYSFSGAGVGKKIFEEDGMGEALGDFLVKDSVTKVGVHDFDGDGINEWAIKTLHERGSSLFIYRYNSKGQKFLPVRFSNKHGDKWEKYNFLNGTIAYPIKVIETQIQVFYNPKRYYTYYLKDGHYFRRN
ncbi:MAG: hypothetical protein HN509_03135 [Halobacteriovoraceae bacterium]|jgi:hypothetical protein|nr:hypothetical protein [Halobacteriovoraceae bacterium]MBT5092591.1 hypothetical protein [Halobacteriovoraceae bacterium]